MKFSYDYIDRVLKLGWSEILWGFDHEFIDLTTILEFAKFHEGIDPDDRIFQLSMLDVRDDLAILESLRFICKRDESKGRRCPERTWLFLVLLWLYENAGKFKNPLQEVEAIYADFDYPKEIIDFVGYMPPSDGYLPKEHTAEENRLRLMRNWRQYLENTARSLSI